ncbi:MAG: matrixin family metalloprotease [Flavobacteriales bacterium]|nr:matrixin family metalloprotease [Flavobacteriales bacterium]
MKFYYLLFVFIMLSCSKSREITSTTVVALQPYKGFPTNKIDTLSKAISEFYSIDVVVLPELDMPKSAFVNIKSPRYRADSIIRIQSRNRPDSLDFIVGLTDKDISITKKEVDGSIKKPEWRYNDFGVMGLAYCPGKSAIISSFRLKTNDSKLHFTRLKKVTIHEFGHNLGLPHCPNTHCVMTSANEKISTIDTEKMELCENCKKKLL